MCYKNYKTLTSVLFFLILLLSSVAANGQLCQQLTDELYAWAESDIDFDDFSFLVDVGQNKPFPKDYVVTQDILEIFRTTNFYAKGRSYWRADDLKEKYPNLSLEEIAALIRYSDSGYTEVNSALRKMKFEDIPLSTKSAILTIISALNKLTTFQGDVFRFGDISPERLNEIKKAMDNKNPIVENTFFSTSLGNPETNNHSIMGFSRRNTFFLIKTFSGLNFRDIAKLPSEDEVLLKPYTRFLVEKVVESVGEPTKIYLKEIPD